MSLPKLEQLKTLFLQAKVDFKASVLAVINAVSSELENYVKTADLTTTLNGYSKTGHGHKAAEVTFTDGQDFQTKLDNGSLKGPKGDKGEPGQDGAAGKDGAAGAKGDPGPNLVDTTTSTSLNGLIKGNGTKIAPAVDGTDYLSPATVSSHINSAVSDYATKAILVTLSASKWANNSQTVTATGVLADENTQEIRVMPHSSSITDYKNAAILCTTQAKDSLTFTCESQPSADIKVYVNMEKVIWGGGN